MSVYLSITHHHIPGLAEGFSHGFAPNPMCAPSLDQSSAVVRFGQKFAAVLQAKNAGSNTGRR